MRDDIIHALNTLNTASAIGIVLKSCNIHGEDNTCDLETWVSYPKYCMPPYYKNVRLELFYDSQWILDIIDIGDSTNEVVIKSIYGSKNIYNELSKHFDVAGYNDEIAILVDKVNEIFRKIETRLNNIEHRGDWYDYTELKLKIEYPFK